MRLIITSCLLTVFVFSSYCQENSRQMDLTEKQQFDFFEAVQTRIGKLQNKLHKSAYSRIEKLQKQEKKLIAKMEKKDSAKAKLMLSESKALYNNFQKKLREPGTQEWKEYLPAIDSLQTSINFLGTNKLLNERFAKSVLASTGTIKQYTNGLQATAEIQQYLNDRKRLLIKQFEQVGLVRELKNLNKQLFYYQQQYNKFKLLISDGSKLERKMLLLLRESNAFKDFFTTNSQFNSLFPVGSSVTSAGTTDNLQTIADVQAGLQRAGMDNMAVNEALTSAQNEPLTNSSALRLPGTNQSGDLTMPDFKPNQQKTKSFLQRLELGWNLQTKRASIMLPSIADIGLNIGYKLNDNSIIGGGMAYKLGMGNGWKDIRFSHQGVSLRTFMDIKIKGGLWLSGGYERNYMQAFSRFSQINDWQKSALLGITKKLKINKKKETKIQLLYDFFNRTNGQLPVQFRYGQLF